MEINLIPLSVIIPTYERDSFLKRTLKSILLQSHIPHEIIIVDASESNMTENVCWIIQEESKNINCQIKYLKAKEKGAAKQRNQGIEEAGNNIIAFMDDDIILEENCLKLLWEGINQEDCGGINAVITNQSYHPIGLISKLVYFFITGKIYNNYAGKCIGPVITFLPENRTDIHSYVEMECLNSTCTLYKRNVLPSPVFDTYFTGYSLMEDIALSLRVRKKAKLYNASQARIFHDSQPGEGKTNIALNAEMDLANRYYVMKHILEKKRVICVVQLFFQQLFSLISTKRVIKKEIWKGKIKGGKKIINI